MPDVEVPVVAAVGTTLLPVVLPLVPPGVWLTNREPQTGHVSEAHGTDIGCVTVTPHIRHTHKSERPVWAAPEPDWPPPCAGPSTAVPVSADPPIPIPAGGPPATVTSAVF